MPTYFNLQALYSGSVNTAKIASNAVTIAKIASLGSDPNADRIIFWDDSAGALKFLTAGTGLTITDTTITASATADIARILAYEDVAVANTSEAQLASVSLAGYNIQDVIKVFMSIEKQTANNMLARIRIADGTNTFTSASKSVGSSGTGNPTYEYTISGWGNSSASEYWHMKVELMVGGVYTREYNTMIDDWLPSSTLSIRGNTDVGTGFIKVIAYRLKYS